MSVTTRGVFRGPHHIAIEQTATPRTGPTDLLLDVVACGVCGSDVSSYRHGSYVSPGQVMGHEIVGSVRVCGEQLDQSLVDQLVMVRPMRACARCWACRQGDVHLCAGTAERSLSFGLPGGYATTLLVPEVGTSTQVVPLAQGVRVDDAIWAEPLSVAWRAVRRAGLGPGRSVAVVGAGSVGLAVAAAATAVAADVTVVEPRPRRRQLAEGLLDVHAVAPGEGLVRVGSAIDTSGVSAGVEEALARLRPGGVLNLVGVTDAPVPLRPGLEVRGSFGYRPEDFDAATTLINQGRVRLGDAVTHRIPLERLSEAFETVRGDADAGKVVVVP